MSRTAVYDKLNRMEPEVSAALVRYSSEQLSSCIREMAGALPEWVEGHRVRILDGNCLAATDHRLAVLRPYAAKALPGKSLVGLEPALQLATHVFPCLDGKVEAELSWYYLVEDIQATYRSLRIAIEPSYWQQWRDYATPQLAQHLLELAAQVNLKTFLKQPRSPKRKKPPLIVDRKRRHLSTQRLLEEERANP